MLNAQWQGEAFTIPSSDGGKTKLAMAWTIGAHARFLLGSADAKVRPHIGVFAGYGQSRLRISMEFADDLDGNSVPDNLEDDGQAGRNCGTVVFPYSGTCDSRDHERAAAMRDGAESRPTRVDTVTMGPGFAGVSFGLTASLAKHFGLFAEVQLGAWFPDIASGLLDVSVGPSIKF